MRQYGVSPRLSRYTFRGGDPTHTREPKSTIAILFGFVAAYRDSQVAFAHTSRAENQQACRWRRNVRWPSRGSPHGESGAVPQEAFIWSINATYHEQRAGGFRSLVSQPHVHCAPQELALPGAILRFLPFQFGLRHIQDLHFQVDPFTPGRQQVADHAVADE